MTNKEQQPTPPTVLFTAVEVKELCREITQEYVNQMVQEVVNLRTIVNELKAEQTELFAFVNQFKAKYETAEIEDRITAIEEYQLHHFNSNHNNSGNNNSNSNSN
jgi:EAL domain-containing protein (putative c-di-GMP-specific phosphodiesterase class I)